MTPSCTARKLPARAVPLSTLLLSAALFVVLPLSPASAQRPATTEPVGEVTIPLYDDVLGSYSWRVAAADPVAQAYFDQGARLMFSYATQQARRSFVEAARLDPACAMCWWGQAWSMGPHFNGGFGGSDRSEVAEILGRARALAGSGDAVERALIEAMAVRLGVDDPQGSRGRVALDSAYAAAMGEVHERFPDHAEVATLYADALMLLEPRRGVWPIEKPAVQRIHQVLESVLDADPGHPGACHAYVHATETTPKVVAAQPCADLLGASIPGASHINHMPSHTYNRVGRWGDATAANVEAWETDRRAEAGEGFAIYPSHNLHMLLFSAAMDGQSALALEAARAYGQYDGPGSLGLQSLLLVRFGRFDDLLRLPEPGSALLHRGYWHFGRGMAHLRAGEADSAAHQLARLDSVAAETPLEQRFRVHAARDLLAIVGGVLRGELRRAAGDLEGAIAALDEAVAVEASLTYDEPEPLPLLVRDYLGATLLDAGRLEGAEAVYRAALMQRPDNGWTLAGLEQALRVQGKDAEAEEVEGRRRRAWERADLALPASRF